MLATSGASSWCSHLWVVRPLWPLCNFCARVILPIALGSGLVGTWPCSTMSRGAFSHTLMTPRGLTLVDHGFQCPRLYQWGCATKLLGRFFPLVGPAHASWAASTLPWLPCMYLVAAAAHGSWAAPLLGLRLPFPGVQSSSTAPGLLELLASGEWGLRHCRETSAIV